MITPVTVIFWLVWVRSEVGLSRLPVTEEIAGSNPVGPAKLLMFKTGLAKRPVFVMMDA